MCALLSAGLYIGILLLLAHVGLTIVGFPKAVPKLLKLSAKKTFKWIGRFLRWGLGIAYRSVASAFRRGFRIE